MTPERLAEIEAEAKNPKKFGWSNPEGTLLELAAHIRDLEAQVINADMGDDILDEIAGTLKELGCSHGPDAHLSTPPMFYREWMLCVMGSAIRSATRDLEAQVREAREATTFRAFQERNRRRCENDERGFGHAVAFDNPVWPIQNWALAIAGEAGELANLVKKCLRGDFTVMEKRDEILAELADVMTYCDLAISSLGADTAETILRKFKEVSRRIGYDDATATPPSPEVEA